MNLIIFLDHDITHRKDETGYNKTGYVTSSNTVIYPIYYFMVEKDLDRITKLPHKLFDIEKGYFDPIKLETFFTENRITYDLFISGLQNIFKGNKEYFESPIKLPILQPISHSDRIKKWAKLLEEIKPGDLLLTFDEKSLASKFISLVDRGVWSHAATYVGEEKIIEAIFKGVVERPIEVYADPRYRLGLYRAKDGIPNIEGMLEFMRSQIGKKYAYAKAFRAGVQKMLNIKRSAPTPNDLAISSELELIIYV